MYKFWYNNLANVTESPKVIIPEKLSPKSSQKMAENMKKDRFKSKKNSKNQFN